MTTQEILASLSQLEKELESISSARLLAEKTVTAYKEVQSEIKVFFSEFRKVIKSLNRISNAFESEKSALTSDVKTTVEMLKGQLDMFSKAFSNQCDAIILGFLNSSKDAIEGFKNKINVLTADYEINNDTFKTRIKELSIVQGTLSKAIESVVTIKTDITKLQSQLTDYHKQRDTTLGVIADELKSAGLRNGEILSKLSIELNKSQEDQNKGFEGLKQAQKNDSEKMDSILKEEEKLVSGIDRIISTLDDKIVKVDTILNTVKQNVDDISNKLEKIQTKQELLVSTVEYVKTGISGLGSLIDNKSKETNSRFDEVLNVCKSTKTMVIVNIVVAIIVLLVALLK